MTECTIFLVRHAEKQQIPGEKDPPLTPTGQARADALAEQLAGTSINRLFATHYRRTQQTLAPLAKRLGRTVQLYDGHHSSEFLTETLASDCQGQIIVAGHSNTLPELLRAAGVEESASEFDESRYGELFIVQRRLQNGRWQSVLKIERFGD